MPQAVTNQELIMLDFLTNQAEQATSIRLAVSFIMEGGAKLLAEPLKAAIANGCSIELITGTYMQVTEPSALYLLKQELGDGFRLFFYDGKESFHPKAYFFYDHDDAVVYVGSSNVSRSALVTGVEWNYGLRRSIDPGSFVVFENAYSDLRRRSKLVTDDTLRQYAKAWRRPRQIIALFEPETDETRAEGPIGPRGAQIEALYELERTREDGFEKALVVAATGLGKTYLAAFDSRNYKRVLFVAHRGEILKQAAESFKVVRPGLSVGLFTGEEKRRDAELTFASVQTIGKPDYLNPDFFAPDHFDYVIVDEFHHAAAASYQALLSYFKPEFLLGLTATPDRMDNRDIYSLCDHNLAYEASLKNAINRDWLVPFRYYGIYDPTDYDEIDYKNGQYDIAQLEASLSKAERAHLVLEHYLRYCRKRALGFCASIGHAQEMSRFFVDNGIAATCVTSSKDSDPRYSMDREEAVSKLKSGELEIVFSVDIFNEGVDIPSVGMVLFLRPTESYTVFMQQLGRGLRKHESKDYLIVLDFIGNYKRAQLKPAFLAGNVSYETGVRTENIELPDGCIADFDFEIVDLFKKLQRREPIKVQLIGEYRSLAQRLEHRPSRKEINDYGAYPFRLYYQKYGSWLEFLAQIGDLVEAEEAWLNTSVVDFLKQLERTSMTKSFKMPTIMAFLRNGTMQRSTTLDEIGESFMSFFENKKYQIDLQDKRQEGWRAWGVEEFKKMALESPVKYLSQSAPFSYNLATETLSIDPSVWPYLSPLLAEHVSDITALKTADYFRRHY